MESLHREMLVGAEDTQPRFGLLSAVPRASSTIETKDSCISV
jgi:hypothetical protein